MQDKKKAFEELQCDCPKHGRYTTRKWHLPHGGTIVQPCPACRDEGEAAEKEKKSAAAMFTFRLALSNAGIGSRYYESTFENYIVSEPEERDALEAVRGYTRGFDRNQSGNLIMYGHTGAGKTHLACAMAKELLLRGHTVAYMPILTLFTQYQDISSYGAEHKGSREDFFVKMRTPDLLILDEFGMVTLTERDRIVLHRVIDERYNRRAPMCLIGNSSLPEFGEIVGERAMRRVMGEVEIVSFDWASSGQQREL